MMQADQQELNQLPGLSNPARRALATAGCVRLEDVARLSEADLKKLHGIGPNALETLRQALAQRGLAFAPSNATTRKEEG
jgi:hypothetical protein